MLVSKDKNTKEREQALREFILRYKKERVSYEDFKKYLDEVYRPERIRKPEEAPPETSVPVSIFDNTSLSALESIVKYLRENKGLRLSEIARLLGRDQRAIGVTYRFARKKMSRALDAPASRQVLPVSVLSDRKLSVLESIVYYLKETYNLRLHDLALILRRDDRTVWTVYHRAVKKLRIP